MHSPQQIIVNPFTYTCENDANHAARTDYKQIDGITSPNNTYMTRVDGELITHWSSFQIRLSNDASRGDEQVAEGRLVRRSRALILLLERWMDGVMDGGYTLKLWLIEEKCTRRSLS